MWTLIKGLPLVAKIGALVGALALLAAVVGWSHHRGYETGLNVSKIQISQYEKKSSDLQAKLATAQTKIDVQTVTKYQDRVQYVDHVVEKTKTVTVDAVPQQYTLSSGWVAVYNGSANGLEVSDSVASNSASSGVTDREALRVLVQNNGAFLENKAKLDSLQQWIRDTENSRATITHSNAADTGGVQHTKATRSDGSLSDSTSSADGTK